MRRCAAPARAPAAGPWCFRPERGDRRHWRRRCGTRRGEGAHADCATIDVGQCQQQGRPWPVASAHRCESSLPPRARRPRCGWVAAAVEHGVSAGSRHAGMSHGNALHSAATQGRQRALAASSSRCASSNCSDNSSTRACARRVPPPRSATRAARACCHARNLERFCGVRGAAARGIVRVRGASAATPAIAAGAVPSIRAESCPEASRNGHQDHHARPHQRYWLHRR